VRVAPHRSAAVSWVNRPMSWCSGSQLPNRSCGPRPAYLHTASTLARTAPWVRITPFGEPVDPELYCRIVSASRAMTRPIASGPEARSPSVGSTASTPSRSSRWPRRSVVTSAWAACSAGRWGRTRRRAAPPPAVADQPGCRVQQVLAMAEGP
jgi:hypothetical protein